MMTALAAAAAYLIATQRLAAHVLRPDTAKSAALFTAFIAVLLHLAVHGDAWRSSGGPDLHFFAALSLVGLGMAALTLASPLSQRMDALGVVVFPAAAITLLMYALFGRNGSSAPDWRIQLHAFLALLAYATLAVGSLLALMLWLQERALRRRQVGRWLRALPPLTQLETLLFRTIGAGFALLTLALITGVVFVEDLFAQHLAHKTVLSMLAWLVFGGLLLGRRYAGWRGRRAVQLVLAAMVLLGLAFFGSKFALEIILQRST